MGWLRRTPAATVATGSHRGRSSECEALVVNVVRSCGPALEAWARAHARTYLTEARDLAPVFAQQLVAATEDTRWRPAIPGERAVNWPGHFPRVGHVDAVVTNRAAPDDRAFVELKCDSSRRGLWACAWDAVKCAVALRLGDATMAYLLAGSTLARWDQRPLGAELFAGGRWASLELRDRFAEAFTGYERLADPRPMRVPTEIMTVAVDPPIDLDVAGIPWRLKLCRVEAPGDAWVAWPPFLSAAESAAALEARRRR